MRAQSTRYPHPPARGRPDGMRPPFAPIVPITENPSPAGQPRALWRDRCGMVAELRISLIDGGWDGW